jgi:hypothetical protein
MEILIGVLTFLMVCGIVTLGALLLVFNRLRRRNRVSPDLKTNAPLDWLWSPRPVARLHRRLRDAVIVARMVRDHVGEGDDSRIVTACMDLEREAVALDSHLILVARLPSRSRRSVMPKLVAELHKVEQSASHLSLMAARAAVPAQLPGQRSSLDELVVELESREAALAELREVDRAAGLTGEAPTVFEPLAQTSAPETYPSSHRHPRPRPGWERRPRRGTR